mmetsp:Transcript_13012/g.20456  ORF Transcript_13012/g.20456 Transcript_13012/m.20456 type:complete len:110 (+) Transcript_13012:316-645(+)
MPLPAEYPPPLVFATVPLLQAFRVQLDRAEGDCSKMFFFNAQSGHLIQDGDWDNLPEDWFKCFPQVYFDRIRAKIQIASSPLSTLTARGKKHVKDTRDWSTLKEHGWLV